MARWSRRVMSIKSCPNKSSWSGLVLTRPDMARPVSVVTAWPVSSGPGVARLGVSRWSRPVESGRVAAVMACRGKSIYRVTVLSRWSRLVLSWQVSAGPGASCLGGLVVTWQALSGPALARLVSSRWSGPVRSSPVSSRRGSVVLSWRSCHGKARLVSARRVALVRSGHVTTGPGPSWLVALVPSGRVLSGLVRSRRSCRGLTRQVATSRG